MKLALVSFLLFVLAVPAWGAEKETAYDRVMRTGTLRCGYFSWPPFFAKDPATGALSGVTYDVMKSLGQVLNLKIEWPYEYTLGQQVEALKTGKIDALCGDGPWTRSAVPFVDYSHSFMFIPGYVYVPEGNPNHLSLPILNTPEYTFTAMDGDGSAEVLTMLFPKAKILSLPSSADPSLLIQNVVTGKAQALFTDPATNEAQSKHNDDKLEALSPETPLATFPFVLSLSKNEQPLLNMLNQGLDVLNDTGRTAQILKSHDPSGKQLKAPQLNYREVR